MVQNQIQSYLSDSEEERTKDLELSPEEIVLGLIKKIHLNIATIENRAPLHFTPPTVPLLEYKWDILPPEFLENIAISDETKKTIDIISHQTPHSIIQDNKILDAMRQDVVDYGRFLEYITERTEMRNPVEGLNPEFELKYKTIQTIEEYLDAHIFVGDTPINPDSFIQDLTLLNRKHQNKIAWKLDIIASEVQFENPNATHSRMVDLMIVWAPSKDGHPTVVGIYFLRNEYTVARLYSYLNRMISEYPEAALYYRYIYENIDYFILSK